jgi:hypothetical protein
MKTTILGLAFLLTVAASSALAQRQPSQGCNQTQAQCVADRVAHGSKTGNAVTRCTEILSKCKKK